MQYLTEKERIEIMKQDKAKKDAISMFLVLKTYWDNDGVTAQIVANTDTEKGYCYYQMSKIEEGCFDRCNNSVCVYKIGTDLDVCDYRTVEDLFMDSGMKMSQAEVDTLVVEVETGREVDINYYYYERR